MINNNISNRSIGSAQFGLDYGIANKKGRVAKSQIKKILDAAKSYNINSIDTAKSYGESEFLIGEYTKKEVNNYWDITTKISNQNQPLIEQINNSFKLMPNCNISFLAHSAKLFLKKNYQTTIHNLKDQKVIKNMGVSIYSSIEVEKILSLEKKPDIIQIPINVLDTRLIRNGIFDKIKKENIQIQIRSVFLQGLFYLSDYVLKKKFRDCYKKVSKLKEISKRENLSLPQLSLLWVSKLEGVNNIIVGVDSLSQLIDHHGTLESNISQKTFDRVLNKLNK